MPSYVSGAFGLAQALFITMGSFALTIGVIKASNCLHSKMLTQILRSPMSFFDTTPLGRILNRFSKDVDNCDTALNLSIRFTLSTHKINQIY